MPSIRSLLPELCCRGVKPNATATWRPFLNWRASPIMATQCRGNQRADPPQLLQPTHGFIFAPDRPDFLIELTHTFIKCPQIRVQPGKQRSQTNRPSVGRILQPRRGATKPY